MWNRIKYYLGLRCVIGMNNKWYVTKQVFFMRYARGKEENRWYGGKENWEKRCGYETRELAEAELSKFDIQF